MSQWKPSRGNQKQYPHFDAPLSLRELERIANSPSLVAQNSFYPFLLFEDRYTRFRPTGKGPKSRLLRYASHRDSAIFSRYRQVLSPLYEEQLAVHGLQDSILAYRRIPVSAGSSQGKSNIHHAKDAFDRVRGFERCCAVALDISSYFESLDHFRLKHMWERLIGEKRLPDDHYAVFRAITKYAVVDRRAAFEVLDYFGVKFDGAPGYLQPRNAIPLKLCSDDEFHERICENGGHYPNLIQKHTCEYGIPQGAALSDLLANAYLFDFDREVKDYAGERGGFYMRYSDDILVIVPGAEDEGGRCMDFVRARVRDYGDQLEIQEKKCSVDYYFKSAAGLAHRHVYETQGKNGMEYLGFRFDGRRVFLRDRTLSNFKRRIAVSIKGEAHGVVKRYPGKSLSFIQAQISPEKFMRKFGRVEDYGASHGTKDQTFWTYARRAAEVFGPPGQPILQQIAGYRKEIREKLASSVVKFWTKAQT